jgi:transcriptional regulator with XRE-family HTH domain
MDRLADQARIQRLRTSGEARAIRLRAGISARQLAKAVGVTTHTILNWEEGLTRPRVKDSLTWLAALDRLQAELEQDAGEEETKPALAAASR